MSYEMPGQAASALGMGIRAAKYMILLSVLVLASILTFIVVYYNGVSVLTTIILVMVWLLTLWFVVSGFLSLSRK